MTSTYTGEAGLRLLQAINRLTKFMLASKMQSKLCKIVYGAALCALNKEDGGVRPIAVENTFRRLTRDKFLEEMKLNALRFITD